MAREYINPPDIAAPPVNLYNHVVKVGNTVYIAVSDKIRHPIK